MIDYSSVMNPLVQELRPSGIRKYFDIASEMDDVISLSIGEPDFTTPWHIREEGIRSLEKGKTWYSPNRGFEQLRVEISNYMQRRLGLSYDQRTQVLVTVGGSEAIDMTLRALVCPGDEVIVVEPSFVCYKPLARMAGGTPVVIETTQETKFRLTAEALEKAITPRTKLLVLPFPSNPTGAVLRRPDLEAIAQVVRKHNLFVLSDEIYSELTYGGEPHVSIAQMEGMQERTVVINGFSKSYAMTGWRLGYAVGPAEIIAQMTKLHQFGIMSAPTMAQYAAIEALKNGDSDIEYMRGQYDMRRRLLVDRLNAMGLTCFEPEGAFYVFPSIQSTGLSSEEFCDRLIYSHRVAVIPGSAFGECGNGYVRISYAYSIRNIQKALDRMEEFLKEL